MIFMNKEKFREFYKKSVAERQQIVTEEFSLSPEEKALLQKEGSLSLEIANRMIENVVGTFPFPYGVATNFVIDGKEIIIPFAIEEPSVVAAASNAARLSSGFETSADEPIMIGQIQIVKCKNPNAAVKKILAKKKELLEIARGADVTLLNSGGGPRKLLGVVLPTERGKMVALQLLVDVRDAMGANAVNTMLEKMAPRIEEISGGQVRLRIISNLALHRKARAKAVWAKKMLEESTKGQMKGEEVVEAILDAHEFAKASQLRATTSNKGIMNGIDAVVIATGNDFRAIESGAHSFAAYKKEYGPLTKFYKNKNGDLVGEIELPIATGLIGGATKTHPMAQLSLKILGVKTAQELARIIAAVGLAQNFAALRALATEGIQRGHMRLHSKNVAIMAGAKGKEIEVVSEKMVEAKEVNSAKASQILKELRERKK
ncbi:MAG: hydroxymethylglutaryl-CoA reductase, degradative [Candidatus Diapherotrites archaeon]|nr:hydroxymethylglutaryl-CoA reductase, degradative [Candidatus Diapherotrites archaeon]